MQRSAQRAKGVLGVQRPMPHVHLSIHPQRNLELLARQVELSRLCVRFAEAMLDIGCEWTHAQIICKTKAFRESRPRALSTERIAQEVSPLVSSFSATKGRLRRASYEICPTVATLSL